MMGLADPLGLVQLCANIVFFYPELIWLLGLQRGVNVFWFRLKGIHDFLVSRWW